MEGDKKTTKCPTKTTRKVVKEETKPTGPPTHPETGTTSPLKGDKLDLTNQSTEYSTDESNIHYNTECSPPTSTCHSSSDSDIFNTDMSSADESISSHTSSLIETSTTSTENDLDIDFRNRWSHKSLRRRRVRRRITRRALRSDTDDSDCEPKTESSEERLGSDTDLSSSN